MKKAQLNREAQKLRRLHHELEAFNDPEIGAGLERVGNEDLRAVIGSGGLEEDEAHALAEEAVRAIRHVHSETK
jgi:serine/threonine protein kinase